jgi:hypothetical protein
MQRSGSVEQLCAPQGEAVTQTVEVLADHAVLCEFVGVDQLGPGERIGEHASIERDVRAFGELQQRGSVVATRLQHRVDIDEVARVGTLIERAQLVGDRVVGVQDRPDRALGWFVDAHVHAEVDRRGLHAVADG